MQATLPWMIAALVAIGPSLAHAATIVVDDATDLPDSTADKPCQCETAAGTCTLRAAVQTANACPGPDEIELGVAGPYVLTILGPYEDAAATGDLDVHEDLLVYPSSGRRIEAGDLQDRIFDVHPNAMGKTRLDLIGLELFRGQAPFAESGGGIRSRSSIVALEETSIMECTSPNHGGAIQSEESEVYLASSTLRANTADNRGGGVHSVDSLLDASGTLFMYNIAYDGAGAFTTGSGKASFRESTFLENVANRAGGAFWSESDTEVTSCDILLHVADYGAGGLAYDGTLTVIDTEWNENTAYINAGGLFVYSGVWAEIDRSSFHDNSADQRGGGIETFGNTFLANVSVYDNTAGVDGGGIYAPGGFTRANNVSIDSNSAGAGFYGGISTTGMSILNSAIGSNSPSNCSPATTSLGYNISPSASCLGSATDLLAAPGFGAPQSGMLTLTAGSLAIDSGNDAACESVDQLGTPRPKGPRCDRGAHEF